MRSQNAGLGLKGSSYGASSSDSYKDKLKKLVCINSVFIHNFYACFFLSYNLKKDLLTMENCFRMKCLGSFSLSFTKKL